MFGALTFDYRTSLNYTDRERYSTRTTRIELELLSVQTAGTQDRDNVARGLDQTTTVVRSAHQDITAIRNDVQSLNSSLVEVDSRTQQLPSSIADIEAMVSNAHARRATRLNVSNGRAFASRRHTHSPSGFSCTPS